MYASHGAVVAGAVLLIVLQIGDGLAMGDVADKLAQCCVRYHSANDALRHDAVALMAVLSVLLVVDQETEIGRGLGSRWT